MANEAKKFFGITFVAEIFGIFGKMFRIFSKCIAKWQDYKLKNMEKRDEDELRVVCGGMVQ